MSTESKYQIGQALIYTTSERKDILVFIKYIKQASFAIITVLTDLNGAELEFTYWNRRPATEAEILAEAVKHGWVKDKSCDWIYKSPNGWLELMSIENWTIRIKREPRNDEFATFGNECIQTHRLITALNLVP